MSLLNNYNSDISAYLKDEIKRVRHSVVTALTHEIQRIIEINTKKIEKNKLSEEAKGFIKGLEFSLALTELITGEAYDRIQKR